MDEYDNFPPIVTPPADGKLATPQNIEVEVITKEDDVLKFTQGARQKIVKVLMSRSLDDLNSAQISLLAGSLDSMDRSALGRKRLQTDEAVGANNAMAAAIIARVLQTPGVMQAGVAPGVRTAVPTLPSDIPEPTVVPGEMEADAPQMDYNTFMAQAGKD